MGRKGFVLTEPKHPKTQHRNALPTYAILFNPWNKPRHPNRKFRVRLRLSPAL